MARQIWQGGGGADDLAHRLPRMSAQLRAISLEYTYAELCTASLNWHPSRKLGSGTYGAVYKGELEDGSEVAIKVIDLAALGAAGQGAEMAGFEEEVTMLSKFRHPNLVTLLGWGKHVDKRYLIYELLAGGDAFQRLQKSKQPSGAPFHWHERLSVSLDAATGLSHMHNSKPKAFHRDIKSANILLDRHGTAKMADFGLSCTSNRAGALHVTVRTISGTPGYACPVYSRTGRVTEGSEVYSLGMVFLELLSGLAPASADSSRPGGIAYPVAEHLKPNGPGALERCMQKLDPTANWPLPLAQELCTLALRCVCPEDDKRPFFVELVRTIRKLTDRFPAASSPQSLSSQVPQHPQQLMQQGGVPMAGYPGAPQQQPGAAIAAVPWGMHAGQMQAQQRPAQPQAADGAAGDHHFALEIMMAAGVDIEALPQDRRRLYLPTLGTLNESPSNSLVAPVGRQHQPEFFETWLPDLALRNCISRTAFEVTRGPGQWNIQLVPRGANPISLDGSLVARATGKPMRLQSEVGFTYASSGEVGVFLLLRLVQATLTASQAAAIAAAAAAAAAAISPAPAPQAQTCISAGAQQQPPQQQQAQPQQQPQPQPQPQQQPQAQAQAQSQPQRQAQPQPQPGLPARQQHPQQAASGPTAPQTPSSPPAMDMSWRLECKHAEGLSSESVQALPAESRRVALPSSGEFLLGRQHQPSLFEALLMAAPSRLSFISRTHVKMEVRADGSVLVTNMSSNPLYVANEPLAKNGVRAAAQDTLISFARLESNAHVHFLALRLTNGEQASPAASWSTEQAPSSEGQRQGLSESSPPPAPAAVSAMPVAASSAADSGSSGAPRRAPASQSPSRKPLAPGSVHEEQRRQDSSSPSAISAGSPPRGQSEHEQPPRPAAEKPRRHSPPESWAHNQEHDPIPAAAEIGAGREKETLPIEMVSPPVGEPGPFQDEIILELHGDGVRDVPLTDRCIGPVSLADAPLVVGRRHQQELHRKAVTKDCLQFLSRDHFQIKLEGGELKLVAMTSNPIWRDRDGAVPVELTRGDKVPLAIGDRIALGTGGDSKVASAEEARKRLCWHLLRATGNDIGRAASSASRAGCPQDPSGSLGGYGGGRGDSSAGGRDTPPSPGGLGPRVSNIAPWAPPRNGSKSNNNWEPLLPPASEAIHANSGSGAARSREERPSEAFGPSPMLLPGDGSGPGCPRFGGALKAPVSVLEGVREDDQHDRRSGDVGRGGFDFAERKDEFAKSGFRY